MAIATAQDIIEKAYKKLGILAEGETATATRLAEGLDSLNMLLSNWAVTGLLTTSKIQESFSLVKGTETYTIGSGADFDTVKPAEIVGGFIHSVNGDDTSIDVVSRDIYNSQANKDDEGTPSILYYDPGVTQQATQTGTIKIYPTADDTHTINIISEKEFTEFAALATAYTLPAFYTRALIYNLAIDLSPDDGVEVSAAIVKVADDSRRIIENINSRNNKVNMRTNLPGNSSGNDFNFYSG